MVGPPFSTLYYFILKSFLESASLYFLKQHIAIKHITMLIDACRLDVKGKKKNHYIVFIRMLPIILDFFANMYYIVSCRFTFNEVLFQMKLKHEFSPGFFYVKSKEHR